MIFHFIFVDSIISIEQHPAARTQPTIAGPIRVTSRSGCAVGRSTCRRTALRVARGDGAERRSEKASRMSAVRGEQYSVAVGERTESKSQSSTASPLLAVL